MWAHGHMCRHRSQSSWGDVQELGLFPLAHSPTGWYLTLSSVTSPLASGHGECEAQASVFTKRHWGRETQIIPFEPFFTSLQGVFCFKQVTQSTPAGTSSVGHVWFWTVSTLGSFPPYNLHMFELPLTFPFVFPLLWMNVPPWWPWSSPGTLAPPFESLHPRLILSHCLSLLVLPLT